MKIALVILHADPARGGAERYTIDIAHALRQRGHEVTLIASSFAENIAESIGKVRFDLTARTKTGRYLQFLDQLDAHLKPTHYDIVHAMLPVRKCDVYHPHAGLAVQAVEQGHRKHAGLKGAVARVLNHLNPKRQRFAAVERALLSAPDRPLAICLSDYVRKSVRSHYPLPDSDLATLFNAVDLARFDPLARPEDGKEMRRKLSLCDGQVAALIIAQDFERKGLREAIGALAKITQPKLQLIIVGKQDPALFVEVARAQGVDGRLIICGPEADVYPFYSAADFFVLPTKHDPCSLVVLEALAMGLPVISTKQNGATEIMENGVDGFVLDDPRDVNALAEAMQKLCDRDTRDRMRAACLERRGRLSFDRHMDELLRIYETTRNRRTSDFT